MKINELNEGKMYSRGYISGVNGAYEVVKARLRNVAGLTEREDLGFDELVEEIQERSTTETLVARIERYYQERGLVWPKTAWEALAFAQTEIAEAYEVLLAKRNWVRNNPDNKPAWDEELFVEEIGDAIQMLIVAAALFDRDPIEALKDKMNRKTP